jgi:glycosyltransferase involved in cell wall biosynthesis
LNVQNAPTVVLCYTRATGGVFVVCESLAAELVHQGYCVEKVHTLTDALVTLLSSSTRPRVWITNVGFGLLNIFVGRSLFILHGFTKRSEGVIKFYMSAVVFRVFCLFAKRVVAVSELTRALNHEFLGNRATSVIGNYLTIPDMLSIKASYAMPPRILYVGRLVKSKRVQELVQGFVLAQQRRSFASLTLIGGGPLEGALRAASATTPNIVLAGELSRDQVLKQLVAHDIFVSLNELEPFGITLLEAACAGLIVCAPTLGGSAEFLSQYQNYIRVNNTSNPADIAFALEEAHRVCQLGAALPLPIQVQKARAFSAYRQLIDDLLKQ